MIVAYTLIAIAVTLGVAALWGDGLALWARALLLFGYFFVMSLTSWVRCRSCGTPVLYAEREIRFGEMRLRVADTPQQHCPSCGQDRRRRPKLKWFGWS